MPVRRKHTVEDAADALENAFEPSPLIDVDLVEDFEAGRIDQVRQPEALKIQRRAKQPRVIEFQS
jgi:hypothetical protein